MDAGPNLSFFSCARVERILVCVSSSPASARLVYAAHRLANSLCASWIVVTVDAHDAYHMDTKDRQRLLAHLRLADSLGAKSLRLSGDSVSDEIIRCAQEHNITRILVGKPTLRRWRDLVRPSLVYDLIRKSGKIDVHFVDGHDTPPSSIFPLPSNKQVPWTSYAVGALLVVVTSLGTYMGRFFLIPADVVMLYLLPIMVTAFRYGQRPSLTTAALAIAAYDFFFVPPIFTFTVGDSQHILTFTIMFGVGIIISHLMAHIRRQEQETRQREQQTDALHYFSREIMTLPDDGLVDHVITKHAARIFKGKAALYLGDAPENLTLEASFPEIFSPAIDILEPLQWSCRHKTAAGRGTSNHPDSDMTCLPLVTSRLLGVIVLGIPDSDFFSANHPYFLEAFVQHVTLAIDRARLSREANAAAVFAKSEEFRNALLSMASHDLRTPLATITGAGTTLRDDKENLEPCQRNELLETICIETERMERLITNLLEMVRLESGEIRLRREWIPFEEIAGSALVRLEKRCQGRHVSVHVGDNFPLLYVDTVLFEHVLLNLLDNALKYTRTATPITWTTEYHTDGIHICCRDEGVGIPPGQEEAIFGKFVRGNPAIGIPGSGLGLAICRSIVQAHGGTIHAVANPKGGSEFHILLPHPPQPPATILDGEEGSDLLEER